MPPFNKFVFVSISDSVILFNKLTSIKIFDLVLTLGKMTTVDLGQYNIRNTYNDPMPIPIWISNLASTTLKMTIIDVGQLNLQNKHNNNQQLPTLISNQVLNSVISKIWKNCESIPKCSTILAIFAYILLVQAFLMQVLACLNAPPEYIPLIYAHLIQGSLIQAPPIQISLVVAPLR